MKNDIRYWMRLVENKTLPTIRLVDLYTTAELHDETETLGRLGMDYGDFYWEKACAFPLPVRQISAEHAADHWTSRGRSVKSAFTKYATKQQKKLVKGMAAAYDDTRIVVVDGNEIIDGNHHIMAAIRAGHPINYIDLADLPEGY